MSLPEAMTFLESNTGDPFLCLYRIDSLTVFVPIVSEAVQSSGEPFVSLNSSVAVEPSIFLALVES